MTDEGRKAIRERLALLEALRPMQGAKRDRETWDALWDIAWRDAVDCAAGIVARDK